MNTSAVFSPDYTTARQRFREAASRLGWQLEDYPIGVTGPFGEELTLDVACSPSIDRGKVLVISSGVHGVEGFFGSAVQVALLEKWACSTAPSLNCVLLHGKSLWTIARHGMPALRQAVAAGQYEFPQGLFFGGAGPSRTHQLLREHMERWLRGGQHVVHLDFHTGLGPKGACKLLIDYSLSELQRTHLTNWFGVGSFEACNSGGYAYNARGGFGRWCLSRNLAPDYLFACAEFGTYGPIQVLAGLRAENQSHHWGTPSAVAAVRAKQRIKELFCPSADAWRSKGLDQSFDLVDRAVQGLLEIPSSRASLATAEPYNVAESAIGPKATGNSSRPTR